MVKIKVTTFQIPLRPVDDQNTVCKLSHPQGITHFVTNLTLKVKVNAISFKLLP